MLVILADDSIAWTRIVSSARKRVSRFFQLGCGWDKEVN